jgi:hypothetical protein
MNIAISIRRLISLVIYKKQRFNIVLLMTLSLMYTFF